MPRTFRGCRGLQRHTPQAHCARTGRLAVVRPSVSLRNLTAAALVAITCSSMGCASRFAPSQVGTSPTRADAPLCNSTYDSQAVLQVELSDAQRAYAPFYPIVPSVFDGWDFLDLYEYKYPGGHVSNILIVRVNRQEWDRAYDHGGQQFANQIGAVWFRIYREHHTKCVPAFTMVKIFDSEGVKVAESTKSPGDRTFTAAPTPTPFGLPPATPTGQPVSATCLGAVRRHVFELTRATGSFPVRTLDGFGTLVWLPPGPLEIDMPSCDPSASVGASFDWYHHERPIDLYASSGSIRHLRLKLDGGRAVLSAWDAGGRLFQLTLPAQPSGVGLLRNGKRPSFQLGYDFGEDGRAVFIGKRGLSFAPAFEGGPSPPP